MSDELLYDVEYRLPVRMRVYSTSEIEAIKAAVQVSFRAIAFPFTNYVLGFPESLEAREVEEEHANP